MGIQKLDQQMRIGEESRRVRHGKGRYVMIANIVNRNRFRTQPKRDMSAHTSFWLLKSGTLE